MLPGAKMIAQRSQSPSLNSLDTGELCSLVLPKRSFQILNLLFASESRDIKRFSGDSLSRSMYDRNQQWRHVHHGNPATVQGSPKSLFYLDNFLHQNGENHVIVAQLLFKLLNWRLFVSLGVAVISPCAAVSAEDKNLRLKLLLVT
jgi:hypothetical protein